MEHTGQRTNQSSLYTNLVNDNFGGYTWGTPLERECEIKQGDKNITVKFRDVVNALDQEVDNSTNLDSDKINQLKAVFKKVNDFDKQTEHKGVFEGILGVMSRIFGDNSKLSSIEKKLVKLENEQKRNQLYNEGKKWDYSYSNIVSEEPSKITVKVNGYQQVSFNEAVKTFRNEFDQLKKSESVDPLLRELKLKDRVNEAITFDKQNFSEMLSRLFSGIFRPTSDLRNLSSELKTDIEKNLVLLKRNDVLLNQKALMDHDFKLARTKFAGNEINIIITNDKLYYLKFDENAYSVRELKPNPDETVHDELSATKEYKSFDDFLKERNLFHRVQI